MSQEAWIILAFKIVLVGGVLTSGAWIAEYTRLAPWWRNPIGRTLVIKTSLIMLLFLPSILSLFFHLNRFTSLAAAWFDVAIIGAVSPAMIWRTLVWRKIVKAKTEGAA